MTNCIGLSSLSGINGMRKNVTLWICSVNHADLSAAQENSLFNKSGSELKLAITVQSRSCSRGSQAWCGAVVLLERKTERFINVLQCIMDQVGMSVCTLRAWGQCTRSGGCMWVTDQTSLIQSASSLTHHVLLSTFSTVINPVLLHTSESSRGLCVSSISEHQPRIPQH